PMKLTMFKAPPIYSRNAPTGLMATTVKQPVITGLAQLEDPGADTAAIKINVPMSIGMTMANLKLNDVIQVTLVDPSGAMQPTGNYKSANFYSGSSWYFNFTLNKAGQWKANF